MKLLARLGLTALFFVAVFHVQSASAGENLGPGFIGTFPFYSGDYPYYEGLDPPHPLYAPNGYYGCRAGCCRHAVWRGGHWHNVVACESTRVIRREAAERSFYSK